MARYKKKLPTSTVSAGLDFDPDKQAPIFWDDVERHTGALYEKSRSELLKTIHDYIAKAEFEANAPSVDAARKKLMAIKTTATAFWETLSLSGGDDETRAANHYVESLIDEQLEQRIGRNIYMGPPFLDDSEIMEASPSPRTLPGLLGTELSPEAEPESEQMVLAETIRARLRPVTAGQIVHLMTEFVIACQVAEKSLAEIEGADHFVPGEAWNSLIIALEDFWKRLGPGFRATAAKHNDPKAPLSLFVAFIDTLQSHFPDHLKRHTQSPVALSGAVSKALASGRKRRDA